MELDSTLSVNYLFSLKPHHFVGVNTIIERKPHQMKYLLYLLILALLIYSINTYSNLPTKIWLICTTESGEVYFEGDLSEFDFDSVEIDSGSMPLNCEAEEYEHQ